VEDLVADNNNRGEGMKTQENRLTDTKIALLQQLGRDAYPRLSDDERDALRAALLHAQLAARTLDMLKLRAEGYSSQDCLLCIDAAARALDLLPN